MQALSGSGLWYSVGKSGCTAPRSHYVMREAHFGRRLDLPAFEALS
jgi:hypothetical protein